MRWILAIVRTIGKYLVYVTLMTMICFILCMLCIFLAWLGTFKVVQCIVIITGVIFIVASFVGLFIINVIEYHNKG